MDQTLESIIGDPHLFLEELFKLMDDIELDVSKYELDHICYRVDSIENYRTKKIQLQSFGKILAETMVNGRLISTFKLNSPIIFRNRNIFLIELPSPKSGHRYSNGLEHAEFVTKDSLQSIINKYPQYAFESFGIHKKINADITLKLGPYCIRFHNQSLEDVIKQEQKYVKSKHHTK